MGWPAPALNAWPNIMHEFRNNPDSLENTRASKQTEREIFSAKMQSDYENWRRQVIRRSRNLDDDSHLRICDNCGKDFYGKSGQDYCKECHDKGED